MKDLLLKHKAEVAALIFKEFDEAEYIRLVEKDTERRIAAYKEEIALQKEELSQKDEQLSRQSNLLAQYKQILQEHGLLKPEK